jgi:hypothetical protein
MSLLISGDLRLAQTYSLPDDADAVAYIAAVEAADGQALETATRMAINSFVKGCKNDGIWTAIKASCILAGARTLTGALIPLAGTAPTNFNFVDGDYNRKTGLVGDGSTKYLNSNRNNNADPQDSNHNAVYVSTAGANAILIGTADAGNGMNTLGGGGGTTRNRSLTASAAFTPVVGFNGINRNSSGSYNRKSAQTTGTVSIASQVPINANVFILQSHFSTYGNSRLAFYSIGESLNLALLDTRVTDLINAFAAAIP